MIMSVLAGFISVVFVALCVLLVLLVLLQSDKSAGMGILGGSSQSAFGSSTADVVTKITAVLVGLFMIGSLGISALEAKKAKSIENQITAGKSSPTSGVTEDKKPAADGSTDAQKTQ
jgi:preprotein translocase subunit SecG